MNGRVLLRIENNPDLQTYLTEQLRQGDYAVLTAIHPEDAVGVAARCHPHAAIICGNGRGTFANGWRTAHALRIAYPTLPLLMLTANTAALNEIGITQRGLWFAQGLRNPSHVDVVREALDAICHQR
ncbi:MAG TPA: hypothetical protein VGD69_28995 [Herpetosiphonaceae bacterium]